jgi:hypothetical protein
LLPFRFAPSIIKRCPTFIYLNSPMTLKCLDCKIIHVTNCITKIKCHLTLMHKHVQIT